MPETDEQPGWEYKPDASAGTEDTADFSATAGLASSSSDDSKAATKGSAGEFSWEATEFTQHHRPPVWYLGLVGITAVLCGLVYLISKDKFAIGTIAALAIIIVIAGIKKPGKINCSLSGKGIDVGTKKYSFGQFKSFGIMREGLMPTLELFPTKKLMPPVAVHFDAKDENTIMEIIGNYLPYQDRKLEGVDRLAHRLRI